MAGELQKRRDIVKLNKKFYNLYMPFQIKEAQIEAIRFYCIKAITYRY